MPVYEQFRLHLGCLFRHMKLAGLELWQAVRIWPWPVWFVVVVCCIVLFASCSKQPAGWGNAAPSGDFVITDAINLAQISAATGGGIYAPISATGSMKPWLDEKSIVILTVPKSPIVIGDIVSFDRVDCANVLHRVVAANKTSIYISGDNNRYSDGWYPRTAVKFRLSGVLYTIQK